MVCILKLLEDNNAVFNYGQNIFICSQVVFNVLYLLKSKKILENLRWISFQIPQSMEPYLRQGGREPTISFPTSPFILLLLRTKKNVRDI